jgi:hypothetical protein
MKTLSQKPSNIEGDSVPFIVGDMLKRNYPLLNKCYKKESIPQKRNSIETAENCRQAHIRGRSLGSAKANSGICYTIPIYLWTF